MQSIEGIRSDLFYPELTYEYYEQILNRTQPYDQVWLVCMPEIAEVGGEPLVGVCFCGGVLCLEAYQTRGHPH
jgi:hypothetical protein